MDCVEDSIRYSQMVLSEFHSKFLMILTHRFESHNEIFMKNLDAKKKANLILIRNLNLEIQEIKAMYEKKIEMKEKEIKLISENYKKRLYEKFNDKVNRDFTEVEKDAKECEKSGKKIVIDELKMKMIYNDTKNKKKGGRKLTKKENLDEFNSKFYHLRK